MPAWACWNDFAAGGLGMWGGVNDALLRTRAYENQAFVLWCQLCHQPRVVEPLYFVHHPVYYLSDLL